MEKKVYVGRGKKGNYGVRINVCLDDMFEYAKDNIEKAKNGKKYITLDVNALREADDRGNDYSVSINTWKPDVVPKPNQSDYKKPISDKVPF